MKAMPRIRQIATEVRNGLITYAKGYNKMLRAVRRLDSIDRNMCMHNFDVLCV